MKNLLMTSFQSSLFSLPDYMDLEVVKSKTKSKNQSQKKKSQIVQKNVEKLKTLKFRLFPTEDEKEQLQIQFDQFRWYYNSTLTIFYNHYGRNNILNILI